MHAEPSLLDSTSDFALKVNSPVGSLDLTNMEMEQKLIGLNSRVNQLQI